VSAGRFWQWISLLSLVGCAAWQPSDRLRLPSPEMLPSQYTLERGQLVFHSNFPMTPHHRLVEELLSRRQEMTDRLGLPPEGEPVHVYLFDHQEQFQRFIAQRYPQFPPRRAYFLKTDTTLAVYAFWGDQLAEDLRHEVTHGYVHAVVPQIPLWLDEGLAEFFEVPRGQRGINREHLEFFRVRLGRRDWQPNLERLERLDRPLEMTLDQYAECWAWVHLLLEGPPAQRKILPRYLADLRLTDSPRPFRWFLRQELGQPEAQLLDHLQGLLKETH
jgi:hypothetical protein